PPPTPPPAGTPPVPGPPRFRTRAETGAAETPARRWLPPRWVEGHGWVLDPDDPNPPPPNARWVDGVGYVVPGPPPE
ncbi:MAG: hypothetical protein D6683_18295, partial [Actinomyces sp.]